MKITSVDVLKCKGKCSVETDVFFSINVRVNTDAGISGFGEAGIAYGVGADAAFGMCRDMAEVILGMDPMDNEAIWDKMHRKTFWGMGGGSIVFAGISAIDIAVWDIKGKALGVPVYKLLGGKTNKRLRSYASQIQFDWSPKSKPMLTADDYKTATRNAIADGYDCVKVDPLLWSDKGGFQDWNTRGMLTNEQLRIAVERVAAVREAGGEDMDIIIELHSYTDTKTSVQLARALEPFGIFYYEEPTQPLNPSLFVDISQRTSIPLASGERIYSRWGYRQFFEERSLSVIQPDVCNTGGITEIKKICDMAHVYDIGVQLHVCGGPIATAATLQVEAAIPNFIIHEQHQGAIIPENIATCKYNYQPINGYFDIPELPGIGQELTDETIAAAEKYTVSGRARFD